MWVRLFSSRRQISADSQTLQPVDRFAFWPIIPGLVLTAAFCWFMRSDMFGVEVFAFGMLVQIIGPVVLVIVVGWLIASLWQAVTAVRDKRWRRTVSMISCPALLLAAVPLAALYDHEMDAIEFRRVLPDLEQEISQAKAIGQHMAVVEMGIMHNSLRTMNWDERFGYGKPRADQPADWQNQYRNCPIIPVKDQIFVAECQ